MARECRYKPELHEGTLQLIGEVYGAHSAGGGSVNLLDVVRLFQVKLTPPQEDKLRERGGILFSPDAEGSGTFENEGRRLKFHKSGITITVPAVLKGTYLAFPTNFNLMFDRSNTIRARKLFFRAHLESIQANQNRIDIDLNGDNFDQCIIHEPEE